MSLKVLVSSFEDQLRLKVEQKTRSTSSPEITLVKCFKYFDLNGNGTVECEEFRKAVEKLGVTFDFTELTQLFKYYDKDGSGRLDYKEFSSAINGLKSDAPSSSFTPNPTTGGPFTQNNARQVWKRSRSVADLLDLLRAKIKQRGANGMFGLQRLFKIMDDDGSKSLNKFEFTKAMREYRLDIPHEDALAMFQAFDRTGEGAIDYDEFIRVVRGPMNQTRVNIVEKAFKKLDKDGSGSIDIRDVKGVYDATKHPDVIQGKRTEDDILREFLSTFQSHHTLIQQKHPDSRVTLTEFLEYYNNVSASIDLDEYFVTMINNTWKLLEQPSYVGKPAWSTEYARPAPSTYSSRAQSDTYSVISQDTKYSDVSTPSVAIPRPKYQTILLERFRNRLLSRGSRGIIGLKRQFKLMDLDGSGKLSLEEFAKAIQDLRLEIVPQDVKTIFKIFDKNGDRTIDCEEFMTQIVGQMSQLRRDIVTKAFMKLDHYQQGAISLQTIRSEFDASRHPDARTGKKSPEEVLGEFLEAFEAHHLVTNAYSGGSHQDSEITFPAFLEFYNFISVTIESDAQFDMLLTGVWNLDLKNNVQARAFAGSKNSVYAVSSKQAWLRDHHRSIFAHDHNTAGHAPFGVTRGDATWQSSQQQSMNSGLIQKPSINQPAGIPTWPNIDGANATDLSLHSTTGRTALTSVTAQQRFKRSLLQRGLRGIIGLKRVFKILDDDDSGYINLDTFRKGLLDYRLQLSEQDPKELFEMGARGDAVINYEDFIKTAIGCMNEGRRALVTEAFDQLDGQGTKEVSVQDIKGKWVIIKGNYNPVSHPDIKLGKKTEEEILAEFIDTFEMHYGIIHPGSKSRRVTLNEFLDYYDYVSALTSDDQYFYQLVTSTWTPPQVAAQLRVYS